MVAKESLDGVQLGFVESWDDCQDLMRWASEDRGRSCYAVDTETKGLSPFLGTGSGIRLIQIGDRNTGWTLPYHRYSGLAFDIMRKTKLPIVYHNSAFDIKHGLVLDPVDFPARYDVVQDTMILARIAEPHKSAALKRLSNELFDRRASVGQTMLSSAMDTNGWGWDSVPMDYEGYTTYAAMDVVLTARLWDHFQPWLKVGKNREVYELEMDVRRICTAMEIKGMRVDMPYVEKTYNELVDFTTQCEQWALTEYDLRIGSTMQLSEWITKHGGVIDKFTPAGRPQVDVDMLTRLSVETDTPEAVRQVVTTELKRRHAQKIASTYLANFDKFSVDGVVHPNINTLAAVTGRMSITDPALQTLHRDDTAVRDAFIPHTEDEVLITCDSDQIEARLFANFSEDLRFQAAFATGDFFVNIGRDVYDDPTFIHKSDPRRPTIKTYIYSKLYGAGLARMALSAKVPVAVMRDVDNAMNFNFPGIKEFQESTTMEAARHGKIITPLGRELVIADRTKAYVGTNYKLQGHAAECLKLAIVNCDNRGIGEFLCAPVHDELIASVPKDMAYEVQRELQLCMTFDDPDLYPVPLTAGYEGPFARWGDKLRK